MKQEWLNNLLKNQLIFACDMLNTLYIIYVFRYCYSIVFGHFGFCSRTKLRLRDIAFEMQLSFHVWGSWIRHVPFICFKTIVLKLM